MPGTEIVSRKWKQYPGKARAEFASDLDELISRCATPTPRTNTGGLEVEIKSFGLLDASTRRTAWRDMKVKVGKMFNGKTVTWSMTAQFTPCIEVGSATNIGEMIAVPNGAPRFRGDWEHPYHSDNG